MHSFLIDTSALVKYYHWEPGTDAVSKLLAEEGRLARISTLGLLEAQAAFAMKVRVGEISAKAAGILRAKLMLDIAAGDLEVFVVTPAHFERAALLIGRYSFTFRLRTLDALQLATAIDLHELGMMDQFVVADKVLSEAGKLEHLPVFNPDAPLTEP